MLRRQRERERTTHCHPASEDMSSTAFPEKSKLSSSSRIVDSELELKVKKVTEKICENLHIVANEPSLALYRISEHVRKALPPTVESRSEVKRLNQQLSGAHCDAEHGLQAVVAMDKAVPHLVSIQELLKRSIHIQQQLKNDTQRRVKKDPASIYQRFSAHINSVDIPDLNELRDSARETAQRVESALNRQDRGASSKGPSRAKSDLSAACLNRSADASRSVGGSSREPTTRIDK